MTFIGYTDTVGEFIYRSKVESGLTNNEIIAALEATYGKRVSDVKRIREWNAKYKRDHGFSDDKVVHYGANTVIPTPYADFQDAVYPNIQDTFEQYITKQYKYKHDTKIAIRADVHLPDENPLAMKLANALIQIYQPDILIENGDLLDLSTESRYPNSHRAMATDSLSEAYRRLDEYTLGLPYIRHRFLLCGNHDVRYFNYLSGMSASIRNAALRDFNYQMERRSIQFGGWDCPFVYYKRQLLVQHGDSVGVNTARNNLLKSGYGFHLSVYGHAHKHQDSVQTSLAGEFASIVSGAVQNKSPQYTQTKAPSNFQYGMVFVTLHGDENTNPLWQNVKFSEGKNSMKALFGGEVVEVG